MKTETKTLAAVTAVLCLAATPSFAASAKKYCLNPASGGSSCGFDSMEQCQETAHGRNGWCSEQVDFGAWGAAHRQNWSTGTPSAPENSLAYYPPGGQLKRGRMAPMQNDMNDLYKKDTPAKGVGSE